MWATGLLVYVLAIFHRSSLGVAGLAATERFDISAAQLATFTMLQLLVYAGLQIPVGLLCDRFGPRSILLTGTVSIGLAQVAFAYAETYPMALVARAFVGLGDAMTFVCVLRLVASWFPSRRIPLITQLTGTLGQLGAVAAAVPMTLALDRVGWTDAYLGAGWVSLLLSLVVLAMLHDAPGNRHLRGSRLSWTRVRRSLVASWAQPGTRLGFWMHFTAQLSATSTALLWGYPFLVRSEGLTPQTAGAVLTVMVVAMMASGPVLGWFIGAHPWHRSTAVLGIVSVIVVAWTVVLVWPGPAPLAVLVLLVVVTGVGGPASVIGFDVGRTSNPAPRLASATGIINQGGFLATLILVVAIGLVLDWRTPGASTAYSPDAFRWAMSTQYPLWALGLLQVVRYRRLTRTKILRDRGGHLERTSRSGG